MPCNLKNKPEILFFESFLYPQDGARRGGVSHSPAVPVSD